MNSKFNFDIEEKELHTILIAGYRMKNKYSDIGKGFGVLGKAMGGHLNGKAMMLCYDEEYKEDAVYEACFPVGQGQSTDQILVRELPGANAFHSFIKVRTIQSVSRIKKYLPMLMKRAITVLSPVVRFTLKGRE